MFNWLFGRNLDSVLDETKRVRIKGVRFTIRKLSPLDHLDGSKVLRQTYDVLKVDKGNVTDEVSIKKVKEHFAQTLVAGVVHPKLTLKEGGEGIHVDRLIADWDMTTELYTAIMVFTYGKKKARLLTSQDPGLSNSTL